MRVADWRREHHVSKAQSEMKAWRSKHKESDGRKIKKKKKRWGEVCLSASCWSVKGLVIPSNHILLLGQSQLNLHLHRHTRCHPPLPPPDVPAHLHLACTSCTLSPPWMSSEVHVHTLISHLYTDTRVHAGTHPHTQRLAGAEKICADLVRRHGTRHAYNVQCHDNSETPKTERPLLLPPGVL